ncbi:hypothetical protein GG344DRAFT_43434 [Lentinula edodes]|nr:hypothetical protein GG344DRAFT_43434 [Lentinula edodes]
MLTVLILCFVIPLVQCQSIIPAAIPLAVRSPYLQAYLARNTGAAVPNSWPVFWTNHIVGWSGLIRVDGELYEWLGGAIEGPDLQLANNAIAKPVSLTGIQIKPTRSILSLQAGQMALNVTFLSPIEPSNLVLQSFPFTYIYMELSSTDGNSHSVQVYEDISGEWTAFDLNSQVQWNTTISNSIIYHEVQRSPPQYMTESNNMASDPVVYHVTNWGSSVTYQSGSDLDVRSQFLNNGNLTNNQDINFRAINDSWPVFGFCNNLGEISSTSSPVVWGIGLVRDGDIIYSTSSGNQTRRPYFFTKYQDVPSALVDLMGDSSDALQRAIALDDQIVSAANTISSDYTDLVSLAARQAIAGMEITAGTGTDGQLNSSDIQFFMKDIGNSQRTNPVEVLYASLPAFIYLNASWTRYLLEPLMQFEQSDSSIPSFASYDLGSAFPSAIVNSPSVFIAIESTSDMLFMVWAHATFTGDGSLISQYYPTLKKWTDTLVSENPLTPNGFITADGLSNDNMTNLAIKGILAIRTMAEISHTFDNTDDYNNYLSIASSLVSQWQNLAQSSGHLTSTYGASSSWSLMYNLYPDKLFGFDLVDEMAIRFGKMAYLYSLGDLAPTYGLGFDTLNQSVAKSHWTLFTAGIVNDNTTRDLLVSMVHASAANLATFTVFPTTYNTSSGQTQGGTASPAQGAMFALLAPNVTRFTITGFTSSANPHKLDVGAIAGGVVGGVAFVALVALAAFFYRRRSRRRTRKVGQIYDNVLPYPPAFGTRAGQDAQALNNVPSTQSALVSKTLVTPNSGTREGSSSVPVSSSVVGSSDVGTSRYGAEAELLREEVEHLRREMEEIRLRTTYEPPPEYQ